MGLIKIIEDQLFLLECELNEKKLPKSSIEKKKKTWNNDHPGYDWKKDIESSVKKMKKHDELDNPYALRTWQVLPKFKKEREQTAKKAAKSRKK